MSARHRPMLYVLLTLVVAYAAICLLLFLFQERLVYFPDERDPPLSPGTGGRAAEFVASDGVQLHGWLFEAERPIGGLVFCHGNGGNLALREGAARAFRSLGLSVLLFDYRGYGRSAGSPTEEGTYLDAEAAFDALVRETGLPTERIALYGESLGGAVAIELALRRPAAAVVIESAFTSIPDVGAAVYPWIPVRLLARVRYDNAAKIGRVEAPLLLIHSPEDEVVPFEHARVLRELAPAGASFLDTRGGHNEGGFLLDADARALVGEFLLDGVASARVPAER